MVIEAECSGDFPGGENLNSFGIILSSWGTDRSSDEDDTNGMLPGISIGC